MLTVQANCFWDGRMMDLNAGPGRRRLTCSDACRDRKRSWMKNGGPVSLTRSKKRNPLPWKGSPLWDMVTPDVKRWNFVRAPKAVKS